MFFIFDNIVHEGVILCLLWIVTDFINEKLSDGQWQYGVENKQIAATMEGDQIRREYFEMKY